MGGRLGLQAPFKVGDIPETAETVSCQPWLSPNAHPPKNNGAEGRTPSLFLLWVDRDAARWSHDAKFTLDALPLDSRRRQERLPTYCTNTCPFKASPFLMVAVGGRERRCTLCD